MRKCGLVRICTNTHHLFPQYTCTVTLKSVSELLISIYFHTRKKAKDSS